MVRYNKSLDFNKNEPGQPTACTLTISYLCDPLIMHKIKYINISSMTIFSARLDIALLTSRFLRLEACPSLPLLVSSVWKTGVTFICCTGRPSPVALQAAETCLSSRLSGETGTFDTVLIFGQVSKPTLALASVATQSLRKRSAVL